MCDDVELMELVGTIRARLNAVSKLPVPPPPRDTAVPLSMDLALDAAVASYGTVGEYHYAQAPTQPASGGVVFGGGSWGR
jgi:hypothetical protein